MAGFRTHITVSAACGVGYAFWGNSYLQSSWGSCAVAGGLCAISGMLPDLDSDSGVPARETIGFAAAIIPMVLVDRFRELGVSLDQVVLIGAPLYLLLRFGVGTVLASLTVHRGMFHSIPAMVIAGMIAYLLLDSRDQAIRVFKAAGVSVGYLSHLMLDEIWSFEFAAGVPRVKKSFGTALKFFGDNAGANSFAYGIALLLGMAIMREEAVMQSAGIAITPPQAVQSPPRINPPRYAVPGAVRPAPQQRMPVPMGPVRRDDFGPAPQFENSRPLERAPNDRTWPRSAEEDPAFRPRSNVE